MTKILDYLVENYIYVAAISGFFIIVLIGYLVKDKRKKVKKENNKNIESNVEHINEKEDSLEKKEVDNISNEKKLFPFVEQSLEVNKVEVKDVEEIIASPVQETLEIKEVNEIETGIEEKVQEVEELPETNLDVKPFNFDNVEPSNNKFQVILEPQEIAQNTGDSSLKDEVEVIDLDDTIVLDKRILDDQIDIVDFREINKFQSNDQIPNPSEQDN
jgi:hypothetical protein